VLGESQNISFDKNKVINANTNIIINTNNNNKEIFISHEPLNNLKINITNNDIGKKNSMQIGQLNKRDSMQVNNVPNNGNNVQNSSTFPIKENYITTMHNNKQHINTNIANNSVLGQDKNENNINDKQQPPNFIYDTTNQINHTSKPKDKKAKCCFS